MDIAVITGASSGLGKVFAEKVCVRYPDLDEVWLIARRKDRMEQFAQEHPTVNIRPIALDLSLDSSYEELAAILAEPKPNIRAFINNAGFNKMDRFDKAKKSDILSTINVNVKGMTMVNKVCLPYLSKGSFEIITGSVGSFAPIPGQAVYSGSKVYTRFFAVALREELKKKRTHELCEACNYPRATFYNYFDDIYDLLNYVWYCMEKDIDISDYPDIKQEERIYVIFSRVNDYFVTWRERLDKVMKHNPVGGAFVLSCGRYVQSRTTEILKADGCDTTHDIPSEMVAEHYGNTIQLVLEWSFLRGTSMSKDSALKCLRTLLSEL